MKSNILELPCQKGTPERTLQRDNELLHAENRYLKLQCQRYSAYCRDLAFELYMGE